MKYTSSTGWIINTRKLKRDDHAFLKSLDLASTTARQEFIDECLSLYLKAWGIDLVDYEASMKRKEGLKS